VSEIFEEIVDLMNLKIEIINYIKDYFHLDSNIVLVVKAYADSKPEFVLTNKCIKFAADTNSEIHFDNYFFM